MGFFNSGLFWFIEGIVFCLFLIGFKFWMEDKKISLNFWKWTLLILWILLFEFSIAFVTTSIGENETIAAWKGFMVFGFISVITGVGLWRILMSGKSKNKSKEVEE